MDSKLFSLHTIETFWNKIKDKFYVKPADGIPKSDLDTSVQSSLDKADSALQEHQDISGKQDKSTAVTHAANTAVGSVTKPVYIDANGVATEIAHSINADVPANAKFTDTTYDDATQSEHGLMAAADKVTLDSVTRHFKNINFAELRPVSGDDSASYVSLFTIYFPQNVSAESSIILDMNFLDCNYQLHFTVNSSDSSGNATYSSKMYSTDRKSVFYSLSKQSYIPENKRDVLAVDVFFMYKQFTRGKRNFDISICLQGDEGFYVEICPSKIPSSIPGSLIHSSTHCSGFGTMHYSRIEGINFLEILYASAKTTSPQTFQITADSSVVFPTYNILFRLNDPDNNEYRVVLGKDKTLTLLDPMPADIHYVIGAVTY